MNHMKFENIENRSRQTEALKRFCKEYVVVSMRKLVDCQKEQIKNKKPVAIIWAFNDCIAYSRLEDLSGEFYFGGRKKRKDSTHDIELMVKIDKQKLIKIK